MFCCYSSAGSDRNRRNAMQYNYTAERFSGRTKPHIINPLLTSFSRSVRESIASHSVDKSLIHAIGIVKDWPLLSPAFSKTEGPLLRIGEIEQEKEMNRVGDFWTKVSITRKTIKLTNNTFLNHNQIITLTHKKFLRCPVIWIFSTCTRHVVINYIFVKHWLIFRISMVVCKIRNHYHNFFFFQWHRIRACVRSAVTTPDNTAIYFNEIRKSRCRSGKIIVVNRYHFSLWAYKNKKMRQWWISD